MSEKEAMELIARSLEAQRRKLSFVRSTLFFGAGALAQAADELLNIAGVTASMVIYPMGDGDVFISARSIGELNVQLVMEALGGGGSRSSAAVQLHDVSVAQAVQMARKAIDENLEN